MPGQRASACGRTSSSLYAATGSVLPFSESSSTGWRRRTEGVADEPVGSLAEEHFARLRRLLQPGGNVDRVTEGERFARVRLADDDLARVDSRARPQPETEVPLELVVEGLEPLPHLHRRPHSPQRVVLADDGQSEDREQTVARKLLDGSPVAGEHVRHLHQAARFRAAEGLGVERCTGGAGGGRGRRTAR